MFGKKTFIIVTMKTMPLISFNLHFVSRSYCKKLLIIDIILLCILSFSSEHVYLHFILKGVNIFNLQSFVFAFKTRFTIFCYISTKLPQTSLSFDKISNVFFFFLRITYCWHTKKISMYFIYISCIVHVIKLIIFAI